MKIFLKTRELIYEMVQVLWNENLPVYIFSTGMLFVMIPSS